MEENIYPQAESDRYPTLRRGVHYPLCYAGTKISDKSIRTGLSFQLPLCKRFSGLANALTKNLHFLVNSMQLTVLVLGLFYAYRKGHQQDGGLRY